MSLQFFVVRGEVKTPVTLSETATVEELRHYLQERKVEGAATDRLIYGGRILQGHETLRSLGLTNHTTVLMAPPPPPPVAPQPYHHYPYLPHSVPIAIAEVRQINIDEERAQHLIRVKALSFWVRIFAFIDVIFLIFWAFYEWPFAIAALLALAGYSGARHYNFGLVLLYFFYLLAAIGMRIYWMIEEKQIAFRVITVLAIVVEVYIASLVLQLLRDISKLTPEDRAILDGDVWATPGWVAPPVVVRPVSYVPPQPYYAPYYGYGSAVPPYPSGPAGEPQFPAQQPYRLGGDEPAARPPAASVSQQPQPQASAMEPT